MGVFICWSGARSKTIATALKDLLTPVLDVEPQELFLSDDIERGVAWFEQVIAQLGAASAGILCLTPENLASPWLHFEAGALASRMAALDAAPDEQAARSVGGRIYTLLHDVEPGQLEGPLSFYQGTPTTRRAVGTLIASLVRRRGHDPARWQERLDAHWPAFERALSGAMVRLEELLPTFPTLFQRKTFTEPLHRCVDQRWLDRYEGASETGRQLSAYAPLVRAACPRYQIDLFEAIREQVDGYAMELSAKLMEMKRFDAGDDGDLVIEPRIRSACERRRLDVRTLVRRALDVAAAPLTDDAVRYLSSTFDQRKELIHRLENRIRALAGRAGEPPAAAGSDVADGAERLPSAAELRQYRESAWDLDRIYFYLVMEYAGPATSTQAASAARDVELELERLRAQPTGGSLTPTHYALGAVKAATRHGVDAATWSVVERALTEVERYIEASAERDAGGHVRRTVGEIRRQQTGPAS